MSFNIKNNQINGSDGMNRLVGSVNKIMLSLGTGQKKVFDSELPIRDKLRNIDTT